MLKYIKSLLIVTFLLISIGASGAITVVVKVNNQTSDTLTVYIESAENVGSNSVKSLFSKFLLPNQSLEQSVTIDKHSMLSGYAILKQGGRTPSQYKLMSKNSDQFTYNITLENNDKKQLTDLTNAETMLQYTPSNFLDVDITPKPISSLFSSYLGGLVLFVEETGKLKRKIIHSISPFDLGVMMKPSVASVGTGQNSQEINFANELSQNINANIPLASQLGITWNNSSMYSVKLEYRDLGVIDWRNESDNKDIVTAFYALNHNAHYNLGFLKATNPGMKMKQINQAYVFDGIFIEVKQGSRIAGSNAVDGSTFFTNVGNFKISNSSLNKKVYGSSYLGYWCNNLAADLTGMLGYSLAVYYKVENSSLMAKNETESIAEYQKIRAKNPTMPNLTTKSSIQQYFQNKVQEFIALNPTKAGDINLITPTIGSSDPLNHVSDEAIVSRYVELLKSQNIDVDSKGVNVDAAKILIKKSQQ